MALHDPIHLGVGGGTALHGDAVKKLANAITELQSITVSVVTGNVAPDTNMTLTGITTDDTILAAIEQTTADGLLADHAGTVTVTAADTIQSSAATTGANLVVVWVAH